eukprot:1158624-Pelagomonas_calceolata.AAC.6
MPAQSQTILKMHIKKEEIMTMVSPSFVAQNPLKAQGTQTRTASKTGEGTVCDQHEKLGLLASFKGSFPNNAQKSKDHRSLRCGL